MITLKTEKPDFQHSTDKLSYASNKKIKIKNLFIANQKEMKNNNNHMLIT